MNLTLATYNVNGVNGRLPRLLEWLRETSPDIACLQELKTDDSKQRWFERFIVHARTLCASKKPVALAGDLNVVPTDFDISNPSWWRFDAVMQPQTRDAYHRLLAQGWRDAIRHLHPKQRMYTYWTNETAFRKDRGFRLDFLLLNAPLKGRLREAGVDRDYRIREKPSDHAPAWIKLASPAAAAA